LSKGPRIFQGSKRAFYKGLMHELGFALKFSEPENIWAGWVSRKRPVRTALPV